MGHQFHSGPPPPPPAPMAHDTFPPMGMHHGMPMAPMMDDFREPHIQTVEPRFVGGSFDDRPARGGPGPPPRRISTGNTKSKFYYEGYIFTMVKAEHAGQRETWAVARRAAMPISQGDLRERANGKQSLFFKDTPVLEQYAALHEYKRHQIDRLVEDRQRMDDPNFDYHLASIKVDARQMRRGGKETTLTVILKRQLRPGVPFHPDMPMTPLSAPPTSDIIDLTGQEDSEKSSLNSFGGFSPQPQAPPHAPFPLPRHHSEPMGHGPHIVDAHFEPMHHRSPIGEEQVHGKHHEGPFFPFPPQDFPSDHGGMGKKEDRKEQQHGKEEKHEKHEKKDKIDKHEKEDKKSEKHDKKDKKPELHHSSSHKSDKKDHIRSDSSTHDSEWEHLSNNTEDTFDTFPTSRSSGSKIYKVEKKHGKEERRKSSSHHSDHNSRDRDPPHGGYRVHTRKVPERQPEPSPAPSPRSGRSNGRYIVEEDVFIQPEISHRGGRERHREPRPRRVSYSRERPRRPQRAMSYDDEPHYDYEYDEPRLGSYSKPIARVSKPDPVDFEKERLKLMLKRERDALENERQEKYRLDLELDQTQTELSRTHAELHRATRVPVREVPVREYPRREMPMREMPMRAMPMRERTPYDRRPPPIIERDMPLPRQRRMHEPIYDEYDGYDDRYY